MIKFENYPPESADDVRFIDEAKEILVDQATFVTPVRRSYLFGGVGLSVGAVLSDSTSNPELLEGMIEKLQLDAIDMLDDERSIEALSQGIYNGATASRGVVV